jgi:hypothetical protein
MKTIKIKAANNIKVIMPLGVKAAPGAKHYILEGDDVIEVTASEYFVTKRIAAGDIVIVKEGSSKKEKEKSKEILKKGNAE